jgi:hypothetical protein
MKYNVCMCLWNLLLLIVTKRTVDAGCMCVCMWIVLCDWAVFFSNKMNIIKKHCTISSIFRLLGWLWNECAVKNLVNLNFRLGSLNMLVERTKKQNKAKLRFTSLFIHTMSATRCIHTCCRLQQNNLKISTHRGVQPFFFGVMWQRR